MVAEKYHKLQQAIIGCLINWPNEIDTTCRLIDTNDFIQFNYRQIYDWILANDA